MLVVHTLELPKLGPVDARAEGEHDPLIFFSRFLTARSRDTLATLAEEEPAMKQAKDIPPRVPSEALLRRVAADREARIRLDEAYRREELEEARDRAYAEGFDRGLAAALAKAEARGRTEGEARARTVLLRLLEFRFGPLDDAQTRAVQSGSLEQVDRWAAAAPVARSLDDLLER